jgi:hypothetical protein
MITYTIKITELKPGDPATDTPPTLCLEHHCGEPASPPTECEIQMATQFSSGLDQVMNILGASMAATGPMQQVTGEGDMAVAAIEAAKATFAKGVPPVFVVPPGDWSRN